MRKYTFVDNDGHTWERITKKTARAAYSNGLTVLFCPVNRQAFGPWGGGIGLDISHDTDIGILEKATRENSFDRALRAFEYYNCNNENGRYTAFYIPVKTIDGIAEYDYSIMRAEK